MCIFVIQMAFKQIGMPLLPNNCIKKWTRCAWRSGFIFSNHILVL